jgi:flagellar hook-associated protein 2
MPTIDGLVSGIDTQGVIDDLLAIQKQQKDLVTARQTEIKSKQAVYSAIKTKISNLRSGAATLGKIQNNVFTTRAATVSDESFLTATVSNSAASGVYRLKVNTLAQAHQVATQGLPDADSEITQGTITLRAGARAPVTLTIDSTNNTLTGLATAINDANAGISASVIDDGAGARIVLTAEKTGADNALTITNNLAATGGNATRPEFDLNNPVQEATDASVTLGSGPGAVTVTSTTNRISSLIAGVELNLIDADPSKTISVSVARDSAQGVEAVQSFVDSYNDLMTTITQQTKYDAGSGAAALLQGDGDIRAIQNQIRTAVLGTVNGVNSGANRLSSIGVSVNDDGTLSFNSSKLTSILQGNVTGVSADDVRRLFTLDGASTNSGIRYVSGSTRTVDSTTPYEVDITQAAEQATILGASSLAGSTVIDGSNNTFSLTLDGKASGDLTLGEGTYTQDQLAAEVERVINSATTLSGRAVHVAAVGGKLQITSNSYGTSSEVRLATGTANAALGLLGTENDVGLNVQGSFIVNGVPEEATGSGRLLSGKSTNANTADLQVRVTLTSGQVVAGSDGNLTVTRGLASELDQLLGKVLDPVTGDLKTVDDRFEVRIEDMQKQIDRQQALFDAQETRIRSQFTAMEAALQQLQSTASLLGSQLESLNQSSN